MTFNGGDSGPLLAEPEGPPDQIVLHLDMDCFFAACERLRNPDLQGEPIVIGGGFEADPPRGAVATASYEAREFGVHSAQPISRALERLPRREGREDNDPHTGIYLRGDHEYYSAIADQVMDIVSDRTSTVRRLSIDEAYLDVTTETKWDSATSFADRLRSDISRSIGVPASIGMAPTMSCAKIACDQGKPDGLQVVPPGDVEEFLAPIGIGDIPGVGPVGVSHFKERDIQTAGDLAAWPLQEVLELFGKHGLKLYNRVRGLDSRAVKPAGKRKSISKEKSVEPTSNIEQQRALIRSLSHQVDERVETKQVRYRTIGIKAVKTPFDINTRESTLPGPAAHKGLLVEQALNLFSEFEGSEVRKIGVRVSNLDYFSGRQIRLDNWSPPEEIIANDDDSLPMGQSRITDFC